jgi:Domain of unknown function (DUF4157)
VALSLAAKTPLMRTHRPNGGGGTRTPGEDSEGPSTRQRELQRRWIQRKAKQARSPSGAQRAAEKGTRAAGHALPHKEAIQKAFGAHEVGDIEAHTDEAAEKASRSMGAEAFAAGDHVAFSAAPDLHTAAHEAAHVVQQRKGVGPDGGLDQPGDRHEKLADQVAERVVRGESAEKLLGKPAPKMAAPAVQRKVTIGAGKNKGTWTSANLAEFESKHLPSLHLDEEEAAWLIQQIKSGNLSAEDDGDLHVQIANKEDEKHEEKNHVDDAIASVDAAMKDPVETHLPTDSGVQSTKSGGPAKSGTGGTTEHKAGASTFMPGEDGVEETEDEKAVKEDIAALQSCQGGKEFDDATKMAAFFSEEGIKKQWDGWRKDTPLETAAGKFEREHKMSHDEVLALISYTGDGFGPLNKMLRGQIKSTRFTTVLQPIANKVDAALAKVPPAKPSVVQRSMSSFPAFEALYSVKAGQTRMITEAAFTSSGTEALDPSDNVQITIENKGAGKPIDTISLHPHEGERLFGSGQRFEITEFVKTGTGPHESCKYKLRMKEA